MVQNVQHTDRLPKLTWMDDSVISITEEDAWWLHQPHDDDLVINLTIVSILDGPSRQWKLSQHPLLSSLPNKDR